jgi:hypothetical protein
MISFVEFKAYLRSEKNILAAYTRVSIVEPETAAKELGKDFGTGKEGFPTLDDDLEAETKPFGSSRTQGELKRRK